MRPWTWAVAFACGAGFALVACSEKGSGSPENGGTGPHAARTGGANSGVEVKRSAYPPYTPKPVADHIASGGTAWGEVVEDPKIAWPDGTSFATYWLLDPKGELVGIVSTTPITSEGLRSGESWYSVDEKAKKYASTEQRGLWSIERTGEFTEWSASPERIVTAYRLVERNALPSDPKSTHTNTVVIRQEVALRTDDTGMVERTSTVTTEFQQPGAPPEVTTQRHTMPVRRIVTLTPFPSTGKP